MSGGRLGSRSKDRLRQLIRFLQPSRKLDAADLAGRFVLFPSGARKVAARHTFDGKHFGAHHHHGAPAKFVSMAADRSWVTIHVGGDEMIGNDVLKKIEPEERNLGENSAFVWDSGCQHVVKGGDAVGGHEQQMVSVQVVDVADLSTGM